MLTFFTATRVRTPGFLELNKKVKKMATAQTISSKQDYDYFLVLDFEATCDSPKQTKPQVWNY